MNYLTDKIRTIFDGSKNGANEHIQNNTKDKTSSPTVMDCVHVIHWLMAAGAKQEGGGGHEKEESSIHR